LLQGLAEPVRYRLFDPTGKVVLVGTIAADLGGPLHLQGLPSGLYVLELDGGAAGISFSKILKR